MLRGSTEATVWVPTCARGTIEGCPPPHMSAGGGGGVYLAGLSRRGRGGGLMERGAAEWWMEGSEHQPQQICTDPTGGAETQPAAAPHPHTPVCRGARRHGSPNRNGHKNRNKRKKLLSLRALTSFTSHTRARAPRWDFVCP